jgi:hypothetical protein
MSPDPGARVFTLSEASALLPTVRRLTDDAAREAEQVLHRIEQYAPDDPSRERLRTHLNDVVNGWAASVRALGVEVKGLWLVDFDNGEGYYCWRHPEPAITHFHGYQDGFAGRMKIV